MAPLFPSLAEALRERAARDEGRPAFTFGSAGEHVGATLTYSRLAQKASGIAAWIDASCGPGDRVVLLLQPGRDAYERHSSCALFRRGHAAGRVTAQRFPERSGAAQGRQPSRAVVVHSRALDRPRHLLLRNRDRLVIVSNEHATSARRCAPPGSRPAWRKETMMGTAGSACCADGLHSRGHPAAARQTVSVPSRVSLFTAMSKSNATASRRRTAGKL